MENSSKKLKFSLLMAYDRNRTAHSGAYRLKSGQNQISRDLTL